MDTLLAGTLILPWRVHCAGVMSSAAPPLEIIPGIAKTIPGSGENPSPSRRNHCSPSAWNRVRLHPGTVFAFIPESCSSSPGIRIELGVLNIPTKSLRCDHGVTTRAFRAASGPVHRVLARVLEPGHQSTADTWVHRCRERLMPLTIANWAAEVSVGRVDG